MIFVMLSTSCHHFVTFTYKPMKIVWRAKKSRTFQPSVEMGMKNVDKNIDKNNKQ